jgi:hypothetical protein
VSTSFSDKPEWLQFEDDDWNDDSGPTDVAGNPVDGPPSLIKSWKFYNDTVEIFFDPDPHEYFKYVNGEREDIDGVTTVLGVIDKPFLKAWAVKLAINHMREMMFYPTGEMKNFGTEDVLRWFEEAKGKHKEKLSEAGNIGTLAHNALEKSILHAIEFTGGIVLACPTVVPDEFFIVPEENLVKAQNCVNRAFEWMVAHNVRWLHTERKIYSLAYNYSGTLDGDALIDSCTDRFCKGCRGRVFKDRRAITDWKSSNQLSDSYAYQTAAYQFAHLEEFPDLYVPDRWVMRLGKEEGDFEAWYIPSEYFEADFEAFLAALQLYRSLDEIEGRRRTENKEFHAMVRAVRKAEKEKVKAEEKESARAAREQLKADKAKWDADKKAFYKAQRAAGVQKTVADARADAEFPKENRPGFKDDEVSPSVPVSAIVETTPPSETTTTAKVEPYVFNEQDIPPSMRMTPSGDIPESNRAVTVSQKDLTLRKPLFIPGVDKKTATPSADVTRAVKGSWKISSK